MAEVAGSSSLPLATNMCVIALDHLPPAVAQDAVQVVLSDHHLWGGLKCSALLAGICQVWGMGLSMHSNSHLSVSLAAMVRLAASCENLTYACDTHYPWTTRDLIVPVALSFTGGSVAVLRMPGLGVELDRVILEVLREPQQVCGFRERADMAHMRR